MNENENKVVEDQEKEVSEENDMIQSERPVEKTSKKELFIGLVAILAVVGWIVKGVMFVVGLFKDRKKKKQEKKSEDKEKETEFDPDNYEDDGPVEEEK